MVVTHGQENCANKLAQVSCTSFLTVCQNHNKMWNPTTCSTIFGIVYWLTEIGYWVVQKVSPFNHSRKLQPMGTELSSFQLNWFED